MAKAGVSKPSLAKLGGTVACFMADGDVARAAQENGTTRADAAMEKAAREYPGAVLALSLIHISWKSAPGIENKMKLECKERSWKHGTA